jgi:putative membrane protein
VRILGRLVVSALALLATTIVPGIEFKGSFWMLLLAGAIFGLFNLVVRPVAMLLSAPLLVVTLGLFYFILNGILLWLAAFVIPGYSVRGILAGILGSLVIGAVNWAVSAVFGDRKR